MINIGLSLKHAKIHKWWDTATSSGEEQRLRTRLMICLSYRGFEPFFSFWYITYLCQVLLTSPLCKKVRKKEIQKVTTAFKRSGRWQIVFPLLFRKNPLFYLQPDCGKRDPISLDPHSFDPCELRVKYFSVLTYLPNALLIRKVMKTGELCPRNRLQVWSQAAWKSTAQLSILVQTVRLKPLKGHLHTSI